MEGEEKDRWDSGVNLTIGTAVILVLAAWITAEVSRRDPPREPRKLDEMTARGRIEDSTVLARRLATANSIAEAARDREVRARILLHTYAIRKLFLRGFDLFDTLERLDSRIASIRSMRPDDTTSAAPRPSGDSLENALGDLLGSAVDRRNARYGELQALYGEIDAAVDSANVYIDSAVGHYSRDRIVLPGNFRGIGSRLGRVNND